MLQISGSVVRVTYHNQENGYTVLRFRPEESGQDRIRGLDLEGLLTVVGNLPDLVPGEELEFSGDYVTHPKHGLQFRANSFEKKIPVSRAGIERYLGSGLIKGIGPQLAKRIVAFFKDNTLEIIDNDPQRLRDIPGIGPDRTAKIIQAWEEQRQVKEIMLFLHDHQVSTSLAVKIYKAYGEQSLDVLKRNPFQLEQDLYGVGFKTADRIARSMGLAHNHPARIEAGIVYIVNDFVESGHVFAPSDELIQKAKDLLDVEESEIIVGLGRLLASSRMKKDEIVPIHDGSDSRSEIFYLPPLYYSEKGLAKYLHHLIAVPVTHRQSQLLFGETDLTEEQLDAVETAFLSPVSVITGGPGTGKTTCLKAMIRLIEGAQLRYALASPTGRAAKRLSEATGRSASTIHRLLGYAPGKGFNHDEENPLKIDFLVVDEASMLDLIMAYHLIRSITPGTQLLLVGDVDQLPSVGAGDVLRDIISSGSVPVSQLKKIFRQAENSHIITNAHRINQGVSPLFSEVAQGDFFLFPASEAEKAAVWVGDLVAQRIPENFGFDPMNQVQVLTPMYRGAAGVDALNQVLQERLNPKSKNRVEQKLFGTIFRLGDKVMQIHNNYDKDVFNGDIGRITSIDTIEQRLEISFDLAHTVPYDFSEADEIVLAYAISVHKAQGSEFPAVVVPVLTQHYVMLQRNLLYTAITRAEKLCVLVGNSKAIHIAIHNNQVAQRNSLLSRRLQEGEDDFIIDKGFDFMGDF